MIESLLLAFWFVVYFLFFAWFVVLRSVCYVLCRLFRFFLFLSFVVLSVNFIYFDPNSRLLRNFSNRQLKWVVNLTCKGPPLVISIDLFFSFFFFILSTSISSTNRLKTLRVLKFYFYFVLIIFIRFIQQSIKKVLSMYISIVVEWICCASNIMTRCLCCCH